MGRFIIACIALGFAFSLNAITLKPNAPKQYVVQKGDTLWDIANKYLTHPWEWKQLWHNNPQIKNPNQLYQGAVIQLSYYHQQPYLKVLSNGTIKLSPHKRPEPSKQAIPPIHLSDIKPFLNGSQVLEQNFLKRAPYIVGFADEHMVGGQGDEIYVNKLNPTPPIPRGTTQSFAVFRQGKPYFQAYTRHILGYQSTLMGYADLTTLGNPATLMLTDIKDGVKINDKVLLNNYPEFSLKFEPKAPNMPIKSHVIDMLGDYTQGAVGLVVVIDAGENAGLEPGDVLAIYAKRRATVDPLHRHSLIPLPKERLGELMIFKTFRHTSYGLVVRSIRAINILDSVTNP